MDWTALKAKALELKTQATDIASKTLENSKEYTTKASNFWYDTLKKTPVIMKSAEDYESVRNDKRLILIFFRETDPTSQMLLLQLPVIMTKAWIVAGTVKLCDIAETPELGEYFKVQNVPTILTYCSGEASKRLENAEDIKSFIKEFIV